MSRKVKLLLFLYYTLVSVCLVSVMILIGNLIVVGVKDYGYLKIIGILLNIAAAGLLIFVIMRTDYKERKRLYIEKNLISADGIVKATATPEPGKVIKFNIFGEDTYLELLCKKRQAGGNYTLSHAPYSVEEAYLIKWFLECTPLKEEKVISEIKEYALRVVEKDRLAGLKIKGEKNVFRRMKFEKLETVTPLSGVPILVLRGNIKGADLHPVAIAFADGRLKGIDLPENFEK